MLYQSCMPCRPGSYICDVIISLQAQQAAVLPCRFGANTYFGLMPNNLCGSVPSAITNRLYSEATGQPLESLPSTCTLAAHPPRPSHAVPLLAPAPAPAPSNTFPAALPPPVGAVSPDAPPPPSKPNAGAIAGLRQILTLAFMSGLACCTTNCKNAKSKCRKQ